MWTLWGDLNRAGIVGMACIPTASHASPENGVGAFASGPQRMWRQNAGGLLRQPKGLDALTILCGCHA